MMLRNQPIDLSIFRRCRALNEEIDHLRAASPNPAVIDALQCKALDTLPPDQRRLAERFLLDYEDLTALEDALKSVRIQAERALKSLPNANLRRVAQLYCIDGMSYTDVLQCCGCSGRTVARHISLLKNHEATH